MKEFKNIQEKYTSMYSVPQNINYKITCFEYLIKLYIDWYNDVNSSDIEYTQHFNKLALNKLLFFTSAVGTNKKEDLGLLDIFDNFYAAPFGHVEDDVNNNLSLIKCIKFEYNSLTKFKEPNTSYFDKISPEIKQRLIDAVQLLRKQNETLILYKFHELYELCHEYYSWRSTYKFALTINKSYLKIDNGLIKIEEKFFNK